MNRQNNHGKRAPKTPRFTGIYKLLVTSIATLLALPIHAQQSPWGGAATKLADEFTGPIARGFSLVAIVVGGLSLAFSEGSGKRAIGGLVFGIGAALGAVQFMTWLFG